MTPIARVRAYVDAHLERSLTLDEIAAAAGIGKWTLVARFREEVGTTPHRYVLERRLTRARELLEAGEPCVEVAYATGFFDQSHLARAFRRRYGLSPSRFVALNRAATARGAATRNLGTP